ncbi:DUF3450 domain-containing protein [Halomonas sp. MA07-2]|uniref:DUF3450 domain-containing protein n=1 Tax=unclassified Halomonas TaxID=2609666 RepID=UPI003EEE850F
MRRPSLWYGMALWLLGMTSSVADTLLTQMQEAQEPQANLQARIDAADDGVRQQLEALRRWERETRRLDAESDLLSPYLASQEERLDQQEAALATRDETQAALPDLQRRLVARLAEWIDRDLPFLGDERRARVASLEATIVDRDMPIDKRLERIFAAWRAEFDYGREFDTWRGYLEAGDTRREVEFLRLGRVALYYLTLDGRAGGVWRAGESRWAALDEEERREVQRGLLIARDQRTPQLLRLPMSRDLVSQRTWDQEVQP